jgi:hypothetical protein
MLYVSQKLKVYMLTIYFIDEKCVDYMNHHLWLKTYCDFTYATKGFFSCKVNYNYFLITNWSYKLTF